MQALGWEVCVLTPFIVLFGYVIFGMVGFGATITNAPLLAHFLPLRFVVPLTLLLDMFAATAPASVSSTRSEVCQSMQPSVMLCPYLSVLPGTRSCRSACRWLSTITPLMRVLPEAICAAAPRRTTMLRAWPPRPGSWPLRAWSSG